MTNTQKPLHKCNNCGQKFDKGEDTDGSCPNCGSPNYTNKEPEKPLWKVLNEQRTQGEWQLSENEDNKELVTRVSNGLITANFECDYFNSKHSKGETTANAQYTALAVNNLHILAEALEKLHDLLEKGETVGNMQDFIEETLLSIS